MRRIFFARKKLLASFLLLTPALVGLLLLVSNKPVLAANPTTMNFQGKVVNSDSTNVSNGTYSFVFRIYDSANPSIGSSCSTDSHCKWEETQASVTVTNGVFQVELGSACALLSSSCNNATGGPINWSTTSTLYLTLKFSTDTSGTCNSVSSNGFMCPAMHLTSVPFAFNSDSLQGFNASNFVQLAQGVQADTSTTNPSIFVNKNNGSGTPNILELQKAGSDVLVVNNSGTLLLGKAGTGGLNGSLVFDTTNASNTTITISAASTGTSYSLTLPTTGPGTSQCLQTDSVTASQLKFAACSGGSTTLASAYNSAGTSGNAIALSSSGGGVLIQDALSTVGTLFAVQKNAAGANYFSVTSTTITFQNSSASDTVSIDLGTKTLKVCSSASNCATNYASITADNTSATFKSNAGTTKVGNGTGPITLTTTSAAISINADANSTWQTTTGTLTVQAATTLSLLSGTTNAISVDSGTTGAVNVGTGASAKTTTIGSATTTSTTNIQSGSGNINLIPGAGNSAVFSQGAGSQLQLTASAATTTDQLTISNASGATSTTGVDGESINFNTTGTTNSSDNSGLRIDVTSGNNGTSTTLEGLKIGNLSGGQANSTETGLYVGTGWDVGLDLESGGLLLAAQSDPATPAANTLRIYAKSIAGRILPKWVGPSGLDTPFQANLGFNKIALVSPGGGTSCTTGMTLIGLSLTSSAGTCANPAITTTNLLTSVRRTTYSTGTTTGTIANARGSVQQVWRGNASGLGGFFYTTRFGTSVLASGNRAFIGLEDVSSADTNVDPTTNTTPGKLGMAIDASTGNWNWVNNATGTAPTVTGLGSSFPVNTTDLYELIMFSPPDGSSITYRITDLSTGAQTTNSVTTNIPSSTALLDPHWWITNNATAGNAVLDYCGLYLETDN